MDYGAYINSSRWRDNPARLAELEAAGFGRRICKVSQDEAQSELYHLTYERLGWGILQRPDLAARGCRRLEARGRIHRTHGSFVSCNRGGKTELDAHEIKFCLQGAQNLIGHLQRRLGERC